MSRIGPEAMERFRGGIFRTLFPLPSVWDLGLRSTAWTRL